MFVRNRLEKEETKGEGSIEIGRRGGGEDKQREGEGDWEPLERLEKEKR